MTDTKYSNQVTSTYSRTSLIQTRSIRISDKEWSIHFDGSLVYVYVLTGHTYLVRVSHFNCTTLKQGTLKSDVEMT